MKTYNEILVARLRNIPDNKRCAPLEAADVIEEQDRKIEELRKSLCLALEISKERITIACTFAERTTKLEKTLRWIYDNPGCHPENIRAQIKKDLGL